MITAGAATMESENYNKKQNTHTKGQRNPKGERTLPKLGRHGKTHQNRRAPQSETVGRVGDGGESWGRPLKDPPDLGNMECLDTPLWFE